MDKNKSTIVISVFAILLILTTTIALAAGNEFSVLVDHDGDVGEYPSMAIVDGFPAIAYQDYENYALKYVRALDARGRNWGTPITIDLGDPSRYQYNGYISLVVVDGNPAIAFYDYDQYNLYFVRSTDAQGTNWGTPVCADCGSVDRGEVSAMTVVNGNPAIIYQDYDNEDTYYVRAEDSKGTTWGTPVYVSDNYPYDIDIVIANGKPAVSIFDEDTDEVVYILADDTNGTTWGTPQVIDSLSDYDELSMTIVNGNPAIAYYDYDNEIMYYKRAANADGTSWGERVVVRENDYVDSYQDMVVIDGYPTIAYQRNSEDETDDDLALIQASDVNGTAWKEPRILLSANDIGMYNSMVSLGYGLGVATYDGTDDDLWYFSYIGSVDPEGRFQNYLPLINRNH